MLKRSYIQISLGLALFGLILPESAYGESLTDALVSVYNKNPGLKAQRSRVKEIDETYIQARAESRPTIALSGTFAGSAVRTPQISFFAPAEDLATQSGTPAAAQLEIIQPIYQGGRLKAQRAQSLKGIMAAREQLIDQEQGIFLDAATAYVDILRDEAITNIRRNNVKVLARQKEAAQIRFDVGEGTLTDVAQADSRLAGADIGLASADAQLEVSRAAFRRVVGRNPIELEAVPKIVIPTSVNEAYAIALENNPQLNAARYNRDASEYDIDIASSATKPSVSLNATAAAQRDQILGFQRADALTVTAQVRIPIFSAGLNQSRIRQAQHVKTRLDFEIRDAELSLRQTAEQIWAQMEAAKRTLVSSATQLKSAQLAFEGVELEQQVGTRTALDVLDAEQEVLNAQINQLNARRDLDVSVFQLLAVMGTFHAKSLQLPVDSYNPADNLETVKSDILYRLKETFIPE